MSGRDEDDASDDSRLDTADPDRLDHYKLLGRIGTGGMGVVYLADDEKLNRRVAVKVLPADKAMRDELRERFGREVAAASSLEHPGIVPIYEMGEAEGIHYFVMRLVEGVALSEFARSLRLQRSGGSSLTAHTAGRSGGEAPTSVQTGATTSAVTADEPPSEATIAADDVGSVLEIVRQTAEALHFAHEHGVIHRDIKPSNIMVDREGKAHLLDFGLAKIVGDQTRTRSGHLLGTLPYMAPEQVTTRHSDVDRRTDVYSLGVTLYECIAGVRPFKSPRNEALMFQILMKNPTSPRTHNPEISQDIETVTLKCMEKDPARRYQTCGELADEVEKILQHRRIDARPVGRAGRAIRWAERNRVVAGMAALLAVGAVILATVLINGWFTRQKLANYNRYMKDAEQHREARISCELHIERTRAELTAAIAAAPPHLSTTSPAKRAIFDLRRRMRELEARRDSLDAAYRFALQRSREEETPRGDDDERAALFFDLYVAAETRGDRVEMDEMRRYVEGTTYEGRLVPRGEVTIETSPPGAEAVAFRYVESEDGRLVAQRENPVRLGATPVAARVLEGGSWLVEIEKEGYHVVRYPVFVERDEHWGDRTSWHDGAFADRDWTVRLLPERSYDDEEWCYVPASPYLATPDFYMGTSPTNTWRWEDGFLIARYEETFESLLDFLEDEAVVGMIRRYRQTRPLAYVPRCFSASGPLFKLEGNAIGEAAFPGYEPDVALAGLGWPEVRDLAKWRAVRGGAPISLPTAAQWQKAARGVDGRIHPWGNAFDWTFMNGKESLESKEFRKFGARPGAFAKDESPYGVMDMGGNVAEWCSHGPTGSEFTDTRWFLGGGYSWNHRKFFVTWPYNQAPFDYASQLVGVRLARALPE